MAQQDPSDDQLFSEEVDGQCSMIMNMDGIGEDDVGRFLTASVSDDLTTKRYVALKVTSIQEAIKEPGRCFAAAPGVVPVQAILPIFHPAAQLIPDLAQQQVPNTETEDTTAQESIADYLFATRYMKSYCFKCAGIPVPNLIMLGVYTVAEVGDAPPWMYDPVNKNRVRQALTVYFSGIHGVHWQFELAGSLSEIWPFPVGDVKRDANVIMSAAQQANHKGEAVHHSSSFDWQVWVVASILRRGHKQCLQGAFSARPDSMSHQDDYEDFYRIRNFFTDADFDIGTESALSAREKSRGNWRPFFEERRMKNPNLHDDVNQIANMCTKIIAFFN